VMKLARKAGSRPLKLGQVVHSLIEAHLKGNSWLDALAEYQKEYEKLLFEEKQQLGDIPGDASRIMEGYLAQYKNDGLDYPFVELEFNVPLFTPEEMAILQEKYRALGIDFPSEIIFTGKIDAIAMDSQGQIMVVEHKTHQKLPDAGSEMMDMQTALYLKAIQLMFPKEKEYWADGILWDYIRTKAPCIPEVLKSGKLTTRANIDTDFTTYYMAILNTPGQSPDDVYYRDILARLQEKPNQFFKRVFLPRPNQDMVEEIWEDLQNTAIAIAVDGARARVKNLGSSCTFCEYQPLCHARMFFTQDDVDFLIKAQYQERKKEGVESGTNEATS
jgi:ATP-dependent helicase/DNAse subunit B